MDEFRSIAELFRPLTGGAPEAAGLLDDAAFLPARPGEDLVITKDAVVEGVHFLPDDPPDLVARKLLRVNLSDLAAKGAVPFGYLLAVAWPAGWDDAARRRFAEGLAADQAEFALVLLGGDTVATPGPFTASVTALGYAPAGQAVRRGGARPGDRVFVTGTIGDGWLGLRAARGELPELSTEHQAALAERYRLPRPRADFRERLLAHASACADVSDGLAADLGHVARASGVEATIDLEALPLSEGARSWLSSQAGQADALAALATGGDDYELVFAAADPVPGSTEIGRITAGEGVRVLFRGEEVPLERGGWSHA